MDIVHIASEFAPIAKVGGLGDVIYGLSKALAKKNRRIRIFLPKYDCLNTELIENLHVLEENFSIQENHQMIQNSLWMGKYEGLELILIETHHPQNYFDRGTIYGEIDDNDRFLYFCKVVSTYLKKSLPKVIHLHDWPTAACALFLKNTTRIVFTIHNLQHQGLCAPFNLERLGLTEEEEELRDPHYHEALNLLKGAIQHSNMIAAVSPTYAKEILTPNGGFGLEKTLLKNKKKIKGILNGIDTEYWNPAKDPQLAKNYSLENYQEGKQANKENIQTRFNLPQKENKPLIVSITRLVTQKGPDLIYYGIEKTLELGGQFVLLGTTADPELKGQFQELNSHPDVTIYQEYDEPLSHLLYAACDFYLMPSIFEPCGISQMIALRYGSIPLVRSTGGLKDTIFDSKNGLTFDVPDNKGVDSVLERAFELFEKGEMEPFIKEGMQSNLGWDVSAEKYLEIYKS